MPLPFRPVGSTAIGLLACLAVAGCAQKPTQPSPQEKDAPMTQPIPGGGERAADEVAAMLDRIARESTNTSAAPPQPANERPAAQGKALAANELIAITLRLIDSLRSSRDLSPERVGDAVGIELSERNGNTVAGPLTEGGTYFISSKALYRERPDKWTTSILLLPGGTDSNCTFPLETLRRHTATKGFRATENIRRRDGSERALYRLPTTAEDIEFVIEADVARATGSPPCIRELIIEANTEEDR